MESNEPRQQLVRSLRELERLLQQLEGSDHVGRDDALWIAVTVSAMVAATVTCLAFIYMIRQAQSTALVLRYWRVPYINAAAPKQKTD